MSIANEITRINTNIVNAYIKAGVKGATLPVLQNSNNLANTIESIVTGGSTPDWQPDPLWWDIETIINNDVQSGYTARYIYLISDSSAIVTLSGGNAYKTSDGVFYTSNVTHTWDTTQDKVSSNGYKTRYVIVYTSTNGLVTIPDNTLYFVVSNYTMTNTNSQAFSNKYILQNFKLINSQWSTGINMNNMFSNCYSLVSIPLLDTSSVTNMSSMFYNCYSLTTIPLLDASNVTNINSMFYNCSSLISIPLLNTSSVTNANSMFYQCRALTTIPLLDTSKITDMGSMFQNCISLSNVSLINTSLVTSISNTFSNCYALLNINLTYINLALSFSISSLLNKTSLLSIINALADRTATTALTLTLGATNLAKLSAAEKAIATNKNWTLA